MIQTIVTQVLKVHPSRSTEARSQTMTNASSIEGGK